MFAKPFVASVLAVALAFAPVAVPFAHAEPTAADMESARGLFKKGKQLRENGDLAGALEKFKAAYALAGTPILGLELGKTHLERKELVEARDAFLSVGRIPVKANETEHTRAARTEAAKLADDLKPKVPSLTVKLSGAPVDTVKLTIDGITIPPAAIGEARKVNPGKHVVVANAGATDARAEVVLAESEERTISLEVTAPKSTPPVAEPVKPTPAPASALAPAPAPESHLRATTWIGLGLIGVGVIAGGVTGGIAWSKASSARKVCVDGACPPSVHDDIDAGKTMGTISTISFAVAGAGAILTVVSLAMGDDGAAAKDRAPKSASLRPLLGLGSIGLGGEF